MLTLYYEGLRVFAILGALVFIAVMIYGCWVAAKDEWKEGEKKPSSLGKILIWGLVIVLLVITMVTGFSELGQI